MISVIIPAYEMHGFGAMFLSQALETIAVQNFCDVEVIVGDQSRDTSVVDACSRFSDRLSITIVDTRAARGNPSININHAVTAARGDIIKFLFQDDLLTSKSALNNIHDAFEAAPAAAWLISAIEHTADGVIGYRPYLPTLHERLRFGINTIGPPSAVAVRREAFPGFPEDSSWLMDTTFYARILDKYGAPIFSDAFDVASREWGKQNTNVLDDNRKAREIVSALRPGTSFKSQDFRGMVAAHNTSINILNSIYMRNIADYGSDGIASIYALDPIRLDILLDIVANANCYPEFARDARSILISNFLTESEVMAAERTRAEHSDFRNLSGYIASCEASSGWPCRLLPILASDRKQTRPFTTWLVRQLRFWNSLQSPMSTSVSAEQLVSKLLEIVTACEHVVQVSGLIGETSWEINPAFGTPPTNIVPQSENKSSFVHVALCADYAQATKVHKARSAEGPLGGLTITLQPKGTLALKQGAKSIQQDAAIGLTQIVR